MLNRRRRERPKCYSRKFIFKEKKKGETIQLFFGTFLYRKLPNDVGSGLFQEL
jgi:hypothetical protein